MIDLTIKNDRICLILYSCLFLGKLLKNKKWTQNIGYFLNIYGSIPILFD